MAKAPLDELEVVEEAEENEVYITYDITSYPSDLTVSVIFELWNNGDIVIPEFQRNYVWKIKQASLLIESLLIGLPIPQVFFYIDDDNKSQVIDGQQRILSIVYFLEGYFGDESIHGKRKVFRLQGLDDKSPYSNKTFEDLPDVHQRKIRSAVLRAINIRQLKPSGSPTSVYHIFERLNTGGTPLKPQEIRNCVFRGELIAMLRELNKDLNWRKILGNRNFDKHQKDVELILRIFSLSFFYSEYHKPMKEFLSEIMAQEQKGQTKQSRELVSIFPEIAELIVKSLGERPFHIRGPLNAAVLDAVFCTLMMNKNKIPDDLKKRFDDLCQDKEFIKTTVISTSDKSVITNRFDKVKEFLIGK